MKWIVCCLLTFLSHNLFAQDFSNYEVVLKKNLDSKALPNGGFESAFDYQKAHSDQATMEAVKKQSALLAQFDPSSLKSKNEAIAFWINAYNFFMIKTILEKGFKNNKLSVNSVKDFGSFWNPYRIFKEEIHNIGGKKYSLDAIEKGTLLGEAYKKKGWKDARIHFAVNCASVGCPPLIQKPYTAQSLEQTLDDNIKKALQTHRHLNIKGKTLHLTHLFKWYKKDFEESAGNVKSFLLKYVPQPDKQKQITESNDIDYIEYDWKLNKPQNF